MPESGPLGSVRGALGNERPYRDSFEVSLASGGLMGAAPQRPGDHVGWADAALGQPRRDTPDFLDRPADQRAFFVFLGGGSWFARWRTTAIMAKASMTSETCRCQPCQERVSL